MHLVRRRFESATHGPCRAATDAGCRVCFQDRREQAGEVVEGMVSMDGCVFISLSDEKTGAMGSTDEGAGVTAVSEDVRAGVLFSRDWLSMNVCLVSRKNQRR